MNISFMRYNMERSGNIFRLFLVIKSSDECKSDNKYDIWEYFINNYAELTRNKNGKGGLNKPRSVDPYLSMARELGFLRQRHQTRPWLINEGAGKAFLDIYEKFDTRPNLLVLTQLLKNDRTFLIPYLKEVINEGFYDVIKSRDLQIKIVDKVWKFMWRKYSRELSLLEPLVKEKLEKRTKLMYADARKSLLFEKKGLFLNEDHINRFIMTFKEYENKRLDGDLFLKMSYVYNNKLPNIMTIESVTNEIYDILTSYTINKYVSAYRIFSVINELNLPDKGIEWSVFLNVIRNNHIFQLNSSFTKGDYLINVTKVKK